MLLQFLSLSAICVYDLKHPLPRSLLFSSLHYCFLLPPLLPPPPHHTHPCSTTTFGNFYVNAGSSLSLFPFLFFVVLVVVFEVKEGVKKVIKRKKEERVDRLRITSALFLLFPSLSVLLASRPSSSIFVCHPPHIS